MMHSLVLRFTMLALLIGASALAMLQNVLRNPPDPPPSGQQPPTP